MLINLSNMLLIGLNFKHHFPKSTPKTSNAFLALERSPTLRLKIKVNTMFPATIMLKKAPIHISKCNIAYTEQVMGETMEANAPEANIMACFLGEIFLSDTLSIFMPKTGKTFARDEIKVKFSWVRLDLLMK